MYLLRGTVVSLAVFFLCYAILSAILVCVWRSLGRKYSIQSAAILYGIRVLPLLGACGLVALFTVPSFLFLEPRFADEIIGMRALALAAAGVLVLAVGFLNGAAAWLKTWRLINSCLEHSRRLESATNIRAYEVLIEDPLLCVAGVWRPKLLVSSGVFALLDSAEIKAAIQHEVAHVNCGDNLKKLILHFCAFPFLDSLERDWLRAAETAADDAAASNERTALDLASALIKMARVSTRTMPELGMALVPQGGAAVSTRVERLFSGKHSGSRNRRLVWWTFGASVGLIVGANYPWVVAQMHELTELLIR